MHANPHPPHLDRGRDDGALAQPLCGGAGGGGPPQHGPALLHAANGPSIAHTHVYIMPLSCNYTLHPSGSTQGVGLASPGQPNPGPPPPI